VYKYFSYESIKDGESIDTNDQATSNSSLQVQISTREFLHEIQEPGVSRHELRFKESAICGLMRNILLENGLVKNARVVMKKLLELVQTSVYEEGRRRTYHLPRIIFEFEPRFCSPIMQRKQFPLRLTYTTTFKSCKGLTLDRAVSDLRVSPFTHGQL